MMLDQSMFRFYEFITVSILVASVAVFSLRLFSRFATFLVTRPWRRHRTFTFRRGKKTANDHSSLEYCVVCLQEAEEGENMRRLTICRHCFHADCIDTWLGQMSTCPLCRAEIPLLPPENISSAFTVCSRRCDRVFQQQRISTRSSLVSMRSSL